MNKMQFRQLKNNDETIIYYKIMDESGHYSKDTYSIFCQKPYDEKCDITAFSEKYHIPKRTIQDWETEKRNPPKYVIELLEFRVLFDCRKSSK